MCGSYLDGYNKRGLLRALFNYLFNLFHYLIKEQLKKDHDLYISILFPLSYSTSQLPPFSIGLPGPFIPVSVRVNILLG